MDEVERSGPTVLRGSFTQTPISRGFWDDMESPATWTKWEEADLRTYGLARVVYPGPRSRGEKGFWNDMESLLGGRRGKKLTWSTLLGGRSGKKRTYGLTRVVYPDPRSRGEKGGSGTTWRALLGGRSGKKFTQISRREGGSGTTWRALLGGRNGKKRTYGLSRVIYPDPRSQGEKDMESPVRWTKWQEADLRPYEGRLPRPPISRREGGSGTTRRALRDEKCTTFGPRASCER